jgi:hypothetical protein
MADAYDISLALEALRSDADRWDADRKSVV